MSITHRQHNRRSTENRRCPECGRGMALKWMLYPGDNVPALRYCRWSDEGKCSLTPNEAARQRENRVRARIEEEKPDE